MLPHFFNLAWQAVRAIPTALGSSWTGLVFPVAVVLIGELIGLRLYGLAVTKANFKRVTSIGLAALVLGYFLLFIWCAVASTYDDHLGLVSRASNLETEVANADKRCGASLHKQAGII